MPTGPVLVLAALIGLGYYTVEAVKAPIHKAGHTICRVVTFGHKCDKPPAPPAVAP